MLAQQQSSQLEHAAQLQAAKRASDKVQAGFEREVQLLKTALGTSEATIVALQKQCEAGSTAQAQLAKHKKDSEAAATVAAQTLAACQKELADTVSALQAARLAEAAAKQQMTDSLAAAKVGLSQVFPNPRANNHKFSNVLR